MRLSSRRINQTCIYLAFGLSMNELVEGISPPASEPKDGPLDMLEAQGVEGGGLRCAYAQTCRVKHMSCEERP